MSEVHGTDGILKVGDLVRIRTALPSSALVAVVIDNELTKLDGRIAIIEGISMHPLGYPVDVDLNVDGIRVRTRALYVEKLENV